MQICKYTLILLVNDYKSYNKNNMEIIQSIRIVALNYGVSRCKDKKIGRHNSWSAYRAHLIGKLWNNLSRDYYGCCDKFYIRQ